MRFLRLLVLLSATCLSACGGVEQRSVGLIEDTHVTIFAENLIGASLTLDGSRVIIIQKQDLLKFEVGVLGAKDSRRERLDAYRLSIAQGSHSLSVSLATGLNFKKELYFSQGQQREWFLE
ncbi:hypothetical protein N9Z13_04690 [Luminiphilus sp.]|nr:hypothetical protein [Luminiphilus sp.]MDB2616184.1 hypothetical protein [Luminiphilus sp.]MDB3923438.1 hypothetical protein [Luminiphilus sp.]